VHVSKVNFQTKSFHSKSPPLLHQHAELAGGAAIAAVEPVEGWDSDLCKYSDSAVPDSCFVPDST